MEDVLPFSAIPIEEIASLHQRVKKKFHSHTTRPIEYRLKQLRSLYWCMKDNEKAILEATKLDLGKSAYETYMTELGWVMNDIVFMSRNLARFMKDEKAEDVDFTNSFMRPRIRKDPLGAVLIIGAFNLPIQLSLGPLVGAIAAGCTAVLKPSENSPHSARIMEYLVSRSLDPEAYQVVQGGIPETTALLDCKWDKIFYTGNATVGKIIAKKAAETLTPVTLELGGLNPAIISKHADSRLAARRLLWAKLLNAGQVCVSHNYTVVDKEIAPAFLKQLEIALHDFQPKGAEHDEDYSRIVNAKQWQRLKDMLDSTRGQILLGGKTDRSTLFFEPTVVQVDSAEDPLLESESFGPILPVLLVSDVDEAIHTVNSIHPTPLGLYPFGTEAETEKILSQTRSGGASVNDGFWHASIQTLPFGGVGDSGQGAYRGKASFDCFTHRRTVTTTPSWVERLLDVRYPPYSSAKFKRLKLMTDATPDFDRQGNTSQSLLAWTIALGARGKTGAMTRWLFIIAVALAVRTGRMKQ